MMTMEVWEMSLISKKRKTYGKKEVAFVTMPKYHSSAVIILLVVFISSLVWLPSSYGASEEEIWQTTEEEQIYDNNVSDLTFPTTNNTTKMAESVGENFGLLPLKPGKDIRDQQSSTKYKYIFSDESTVEIEIKKEAKNLDEPPSLLVSGFPSIVLNLHFSDSMIYGNTEPEKINITENLIEEVGIPRSLTSENISYWEREEFNGAYVKIYLDYMGMKVTNCYFHAGFYLDSGQLASFAVTSIYNISVEPYLTEYGAKHFALQKWQQYDENKSYTSVSVEGFTIVQNKLMYHVWVSNCVNETIETNSGTYRSESVDVQKYYVDVQNGNVTLGEGYGTTGDRTKIDDDSFLPFATAPQLLIVVVLAVVLSARRKNTESKRSLPKRTITKGRARYFD